MAPNINDAAAKLPAAFNKKLSLASRSVHADDHINKNPDVAPPMHVSTTYRYAANPDDLVPWSEIDESNFWTEQAASHDPFWIYSREKSPTSTRFETILTSLLGAPAVSYASGLAAFHAMMVFLNPRRVAIGGGYHGCHGILKLLNKLNGLQVVELEDEAALAALQKGDVIHVETPLNPYGEARNLAYFRQRADELGCYLTVDATFAPPPLQDPFQFGADIVMHSGTKYFGGHSDMLAGVLAVRPDRASDWLGTLLEERLVLGSVMGSLEGWLGVRSLRTLELRVTRQSETAQKLVDWIAAEKAKEGSVVADVVLEVRHASQQPEAKDENSWLRKQMPRGFGPVFSLVLKSEQHARRLPSKLGLFHHATSLGGVESLIEWRAMSDSSVDRRLVRVSIGVEGFEDLRDDLLQGLQALREELK
ncbi:putative pyridoxal phosphate binding protein [Thermochaetoides thermophila DSM 1495]|uniref:Putative pyridoxal phosphate binding protein n=1 Tax=Chaetomium thermophilum (strain DSM 1495 / CBS 144.50 / IMI 039719) TaxID=759272 RepID=G0RZJ0_CHATD|nr:putative pyridoxal phosphate binding protein [Thermochaetoides thermophila DSM 1495]EGS23618.1 putative pyridoxal phosphate binding protein [Thermochaetoides thermophila DSM 1495]